MPTINFALSKISAFCLEACALALKMKHFMILDFMTTNGTSDFKVGNQFRLLQDR